MATSNTKTVTPKVTAVDNQASATEAGVLVGSNGTGNALTNDSATSGVLTVSGIRVGGTSASGAAGTVGVALKGLYGSLTINANGTYTYVIDNSNATVNALAKGESLQESFTYTATNGLASASAAIVINVNGANDAATITGQATGAVIEDGATATATGQLTVNDVDHGENQAKAINNQEGQYGKFSITTGGVWTYVLNNNSNAVQSLAAGEKVTESFVVTSKDGTATQTVVVTVTGTNDVATIHGDTTASLTEDSAHNVARGELDIDDRDHGQSAARVVTNQAGTYGTFSVDASGHWTYVMNNSLASVQALAQGEKGTDSFVVWSQDGSASQTVTVKINGVNDQATITGTATGSVSEDAIPNTATGKLTVNDVDHGENTVVPVTAKAGSYGSFSIAADGTWTYTVNNSLSAVQALGAGVTLTESFVVYSKDSQLVRADSDDHDDDEDGDDHEDEDGHHDTSYHGASKVVTVTIVGTNDAAVITGSSTGAVKEDLTLGTSGKLNVSDVDTGQSSFQAQSATIGTYGSFSITTAGQWAYTLNNAAANVQALAANEVATETFTVKSFDGTQKVVTLTITGTNDAASISGTSTGAVSEDTAPTTGGTLTVTDVDHGEAIFRTQTNASGTYGSFSIGADGNWTYAPNNSAANVQALAAGEHASDSFTVVSQDGTASQLVTVTLTGTNDAPVVTNTVAALSGATTEDGGLTATGQLSASDVDHGATQAWSIEGSAAGAYGTLVVDAATGQWSYALNNSAASVQALAAGESHTETFTVRVTDDQGAFVSQQVSVVVNGTNDGPVVTNAGADTQGGVTEDTSLTATGQLSASDVDNNATQAWSVQGSNAGGYGSLAVDASGQWTYTLNNDAANVQALAAGEHARDSFVVRVTDDHGAFVDQTVTVAITGTNDAASISGTSTGAVSEDTTLSTSGSLAVADADHDQAVFQAQTDVAGTYGSFSIGTDGNWTYALSNDAANVQDLNTADHRSDSFTVWSQDGSASQLVTVNVNGLDDIHNLSPVAVDDLVTGSGQAAGVLTFEEGTYTQNYNYNTGNYIVSTNGFNFTSDSNNYYGSGPYVTGSWGADYTNAIYSYGYGGYYNGGSSTTTPISMTHDDGATFSLASANITSYGNYYYYYGYGGAEVETVTGYSHGVQVAQQSFTVPDANNGTHNNVLTFTDPGFAAVDKVVFSLTNSGGGYYYYYNYAYQWIDNVNVGGSGPVASHALDVDVLANDSDPDVGDTLSVANFSALSAQGAAITLNADGTLHYDPTHLANMQALAAGETLTDTFTYRAQDQHGALSNSATVTVVVNGVNDAASISGVSTGVVQEDVTLQASGQLTVSDVDHGEAHVRAQSNVSGNYGSFSIGTDGNWTYVLNNDAYYVQNLASGQHTSDSFTVTSADGTATQQVSVDIAGSNEAPVASNDTIQGAYLTFENGTYSQNYYYDYNTGNYISSIDAGGFHFATDSQVNNNSGSGPWITSYWGADSSYAIYSYGYNYNYYSGSTTTTPIAMTKADGFSFSMTSANITSYADYYSYGGNEVETVTGYSHGVQVAQQSFTVPDANNGTRNNVVTFTDPGFGSVDKVVFSLTNSGGYNYYYYYSNYAYQWIDNIALPNTVAAARDVNVLANDSDIDNGSHLSVGSFSLHSAHGALISLNTDGTLHYDPTVSAELQALSQGTDVYDTFTYQAQDEFGALSNEATVGIHVVGVAHA